MMVKLCLALFLSLKDMDKESAVSLAKDFIDLGYEIVSTRGTYSYLVGQGLNPPDVTLALKMNEGRPNILDMIKQKQIALFVSTPDRRNEHKSGIELRRAVISEKIPIVTTVAAARAVAQALRIRKSQDYDVKAMQDYH